MGDKKGLKGIGSETAMFSAMRVRAVRGGRPKKMWSIEGKIVNCSFRSDELEPEQSVKGMKMTETLKAGFVIKGGVRVEEVRVGPIYMAIGGRRGKGVEREELG